jgi:predicted regulator of Ras-like GTPase activity (Roadblock/LC7/MglB family)
MSEVSKYNDIVTKLSRLDMVKSVYMASRAGVFTVGTTPEMTERTMFSAITSMMLGAAEQLSTEMGDDLDHVILRLNKTNLMIMGAGPKHMVGIELRPEADLKKLIIEAKKIIADNS